MRIVAAIETKSSIIAECLIPNRLEIVANARRLQGAFGYCRVAQIRAHGGENVGLGRFGGVSGALAFPGVGGIRYPDLYGLAASTHSGYITGYRLESQNEQVFSAPSDR